MQDCNPKLVGLRKKFVEKITATSAATTVATNEFNEILAEIVEEVRKRRHDGSMSSTLTTNAEEPIFQLVPGVASSPSSGMCSARWNDGYWHIARSQVNQSSVNIELSLNRLGN